ncbi:MAG: hypothetical protein HC784_05905, partial [Hydrococcus sp. CSU_1_8]|nr:hypothetical protein [Hydrococcus sp. CSU_1_8]
RIASTVIRERSCCGSLRGLVERFRGIEIFQVNASCQTRLITHIIRVIAHIYAWHYEFTSIPRVCLSLSSVLPTLQRVVAVMVGALEIYQSFSS